MLHPLLTESQAHLLRQEKEALAEIRIGLARLDVPREALDTLEQAILQLDELFLLVVVGEFNAGKSALVNALLGEKILPEGATPTTSRVTFVKWGEQIGEQIVDEDFGIFSYPLPLLREMNIVDTPGTNAVIRRHERLTQEFLPRSDLVLFVTSADRPMTESERQFLEGIRIWGKKVIFALNKEDILENQAALDEVRDFVLKYAERVIGAKPELFAVSARLAQWAKTEPDPVKSARLRAASHMDGLANYIHATLDDQARLQLKFANPLGVAEHIIEEAQATVQQQAETLKEDRETVLALENLVAGYERELNNELIPRLAEVENILNRLQQRGLDFFDSTLRLTNILRLTRGDQVRAQFEKQVLADVPQQIEERTQRLIDWLVEKNLHQWQLVTAFLQRRQARYTEQIAGEAVTSLDARRRTLIDSVGKTAQTIVQTFDRDKEAHDLAVGVETAVAQVALLEVGAVGLGAWVVTALASSAADITGLLAAGTLAIVGVFVIPYKRKQAKDRFREKTTSLRDNLMQSLTTQFNNEVENVMTRMKEGAAPYTRFVRTESERVDKSQSELIELRACISTLKARTVTVLSTGGRSIRQ